MFGSSILDVAIGLMFIYLLFGVLCTTLNESIATLLGKRGSNLLEGIKNMLNDSQMQALAKQLYQHGLISGMSRNASDEEKKTRLPSYIGGANFSLALLDLLGSHGVAAAAKSPLLNAAEEADEALYQAQQKNDAAQTDAARQAQQAADTALAAAISTAQAALAAAPQDAAAQAALEQAQNAQKLLTARRDALALAKTSAEREQIREKLDLSETSLAIGREIKNQIPATLEHISTGIAQLPVGHTREILTVLLDKTRRELKHGEDALEHYRKNLESWFDDCMDRVSGWYKRWSQKLSYLFAAVLVLLCNVDSLKIAERLINDSAMRSALVSAASSVVEAESKEDSKNANTASAAPAAESAQNGNAATATTSTTGSTAGSNTAAGTATKNKENWSKTVSGYVNNYVSGTLQLPLGWDAEELPQMPVSIAPASASKTGEARAASDKDGESSESLSQSRKHWHRSLLGWIGKLLGLGISVFAISLGAPFWFDMLGKVINLRATGRKPSSNA